MREETVDHTRVFSFFDVSFDVSFVPPLRVFDFLLWYVYISGCILSLCAVIEKGCCKAVETFSFKYKRLVNKKNYRRVYDYCSH